jgi:hypothetical protein
LSRDAQVSPLEPPVLEHVAAVFHAIAVGMTTKAADGHGRGDADEAARRVDERAAGKPSCIGAVVRITSSIERRRPVGSGPPMMDTTPALAVTALLHDRAIASAR